ncbi:hypothetical protein SBOR_3075 [Sclerotinia borealis F-4128]|uniref:Uncharacterized protein n=1 Tax=Sclerotinia borealis (strain F-4128) TaxID=1432307 RepID=W9CKP2_SCLBF|nr:hypothetical protein SBOR_3075 [Sclerotinia borealis F-4128]
MESCDVSNIWDIENEKETSGNGEFWLFLIKFGDFLYHGSEVYWRIADLAGVDTLVSNPIASQIQAPPLTMKDLSIRVKSIQVLAKPQDSPSSQVENKKGPRTAARSHVMREFWREKKLQKIKKFGEAQKKDLCSLRPKNSKCKALKDVGCCHSNLENRKDCSSSEVDNEGSDESVAREVSIKITPTKALKPSQNQNTLADEVPKHSQTMTPLDRAGIADVDPFSRLKLGEGSEMQRLLHHYFFRVGWLFSRVAWLDPEPNHTIMGFTTHHIQARLHGQKEPPSAITYKMEGDFSVHMTGLDQMIKCRGLIAFSGNRPLQLVVESSLRASMIQYEVIRMQAINDFGADFIRMVDGLERATGLIKDAASKTISLGQWDNFSSQICSAAIGMNWLHPTEQTIDEKNNVVWECFRLASLAYLQMALHEFSTTSQLNGQYFRACRYQLLDMNADWGRAIEMLARVILRGERSNVERHRRAWYVANAMIELQDLVSKHGRWWKGSYLLIWEVSQGDLKVN